MKNEPSQPLLTAGTKEATGRRRSPDPEVSSIVPPLWLCSLPSCCWSLPHTLPSHYRRGPRMAAQHSHIHTAQGRRQDGARRAALSPRRLHPLLRRVVPSHAHALSTSSPHSQHPTPPTTTLHRTQTRRTPCRQEPAPKPTGPPAHAPWPPPPPPSSSCRPFRRLLRPKDGGGKANPNRPPSPRPTALENLHPLPPGGRRRPPHGPK
jgi:hypothetical protein